MGQVAAAAHPHSPCPPCCSPTPQPLLQQANHSPAWISTVGATGGLGPHISRPAGLPRAPPPPAPEPLSIGDPELQEPLCVSAPQSRGPSGTSCSNPATGTLEARLCGLGHPAQEAPPDGLGSSLVRELPNPTPSRHPLPHRGPAAAPAPRAGATKGNRGCWNLRCHGDGDHRTHIW